MKPSDVIDHATSQIALPREIGHGTGDAGKSRRDYLTERGGKLGIDATKKLPGEGSKRPWPPLIKLDASVNVKVEKLLATSTGNKI